MQRPVPLLNVGHHGVDLFGVRDVKVTVLSLATLGFDVAGDTSPFSFQYVCHDDAVAGVRERVGRCRADTYTCTGDQSRRLLRALHAYPVPRAVWLTASRLRSWDRASGRRRARLRLKSGRRRSRPPPWVPRSVPAAARRPWPVATPRRDRE